MANVPAWQRNRAAGIGGQGSARANRAAAAQLPGKPAEAKPVPAPAPAPAPVQAQGRNVVSREGKQGITGRGGNFQPLGRAALRGLDRSVVGASANAPGGAPVLSAPVPGAPGAGAPNAGGVGGAADPTAAGATLTAPVLPPTAETPGIESAISNLRAQLGESMPNAPGVGGAPGAGLTASTLPTTTSFPNPSDFTGAPSAAIRNYLNSERLPPSYTKPNFRGAGTAGGAGGVPGAGMPRGNPLLDLLRARLSGAGAGAGMAGTFAGLAGGAGAGRGFGLGAGQYDY